MESHNPPHDGYETYVDGNNLLCPADHVCGALGGISACLETMNQISPYYGPGTLIWKEYIEPNSDSSMSSSINSLT